MWIWLYKCHLTAESILVTDREDIATGKIKNENREIKEFLYITENGCLRKFLICTVSKAKGQWECITFSGLNDSRRLVITHSNHMDYCTFICLSLQCSHFFSQMKISYKFKQGCKLQDFYFELIFILLPHQFHFSFIRLFWDIVRAYFVYTNILLYLFAT